MTTAKLTPQQRFLTLVAASPGIGAAAAIALGSRPFLAATLARNPWLPQDVKSELGTDPRAAVRAAVLRHTADLDQLSLAARSGGATERAAAAANPYTPTEDLVALAGRGLPTVDKWLLTNPALPAACARDLAGRYVVGQLWSPGRPQGSSQGSAVWRSLGVTATLEAHPHTAAAWLGDPEPTTARVLAYSPTLTPPLADALLKQSRQGTVQRALGGNPFLPEATANRLTSSNARQTRATLRRHLDDREPVAAVPDLLSTPHGRAVAAGLGSRTLDWLLAVHPDLELDTAVALSARVHGPSVEPWVLATLTNRLGAAPAAAAIAAQSPSRCRPAAQWSPLLAILVGAGSGTDLDPVAAATLAHGLTEQLGDDRAAWEVAVSVLAAATGPLDADMVATVAVGVTC